MVQKFYAMSEKFITYKICTYVIHSTTTTALLLLPLHQLLQSGEFTKCYHKVMGIRIWETNMF